MKHLTLLLLLFVTLSSPPFPTIRRGNLFQQLMFLSGVPINEEFYKLVIRVL